MFSRNNLEYTDNKLNRGGVYKSCEDKQYTALNFDCINRTSTQLLLNSCKSKITYVHFIAHNKRHLTCASINNYKVERKGQKDNRTSILGEERCSDP